MARTRMSTDEREILLDSFVKEVQGLVASDPDPDRGWTMHEALSSYLRAKKRLVSYLTARKVEK